MGTQPLTEAACVQVIDAINAAIAQGHPGPDCAKRDAGSAIDVAAKKLNMNGRSLRYRLRTARVKYNLKLDTTPQAKPFSVEPLPDRLPSADELLERRKKEFARVNSAEEARQLINVKVQIDGPIGIAHFGDPHTDDPGCDIALLEKHVNVVNKTEGLFGANVGDLQNNWVGRLARLHAEQSTSAAESWVLVEWLVTTVSWLYLLGGNHDAWSGNGDPLKWMTRNQQGVFENWGARLALKFPNGKTVRVNARHDFSGHSMWNTAHGPAKAVQMGWRDHLLTCGHKHTSGYQVLKCPASGLISHAIRAGSYKTHDSYAKQEGLPNQNIFVCPVTIIDPQYADDDPRLITTIFDPEEGADFLTFKRKKFGRKR